MELKIRDEISNRDEKDQKQRIVSYWTRRSEGFALQREAELHDEIHNRWLKLIEGELESAGIPKRERRFLDGTVCPVKILDVGTGTGFFAILLSQAGYQVTGIDLTESMILRARELAQKHRCDAVFEVMDAENPEFADESFDVVIARNVTWTLPNARKAYAQWMRVLKPGGVLLNYDADYGAACFTTPEEKLPADHAHNRIGRLLMHECERIKEEMDISKVRRPGWDEAVFREMGYQDIAVNRDVSAYIYRTVDEFYNPDPLFSVRVRKDSCALR